MSFIPNRFRTIACLTLLYAMSGPFGQSQLCLGQENEAIKPPVVSSAVESTAGQPKSDKSEELSKLLTNSRWKGQFTTVDKNGVVGKAAEETYEITKAEKLPEENLWMLTTRIKYGKRDVTVPLPITILWAGETPVITVDQLLIPGMGTFDARVLIRGGKYSGTWTHNDHGGHLFGTIDKMETETETK